MHKILPALLVLLLSGCTSPEEHRRRTVEMADEMLARGDRSAAVAALEGFLRYDPRDLAVTVRLAQLDLDDGEAHAALRRLEGLPSEAPRQGELGDDYFEALTRARVHAGCVEQALPMLLARPDLSEADPKLVDVFLERSYLTPHLDLPDLPEAWRARRVEGLIRQGHLAAALDQWRRLASADTRLVELLFQAALARSELNLLRQAEEVHAEPPTPWKLLARHRLFLERAEEGEAAEVERQFLSRYPGHPRRFDVLMSRLRRENRSGRPNEALRLADEATALRPSDLAAMVERALALRSLGRMDRARSQLEQVLAQDPTYEAARMLLHRDDEARREKRDKEAGKNAGTLSRLELKLEAGGT